MLARDALIPVGWVNFLQNCPILFDDRLAHENEELRGNPKVLGKSNKHLGLSIRDRAQGHVGREDLAPMDDDVGPCRVGQNKLVKILCRVESKELGR